MGQPPNETELRAAERKAGILPPAPASQEAKPVIEQGMKLIGVTSDGRSITTRKDPAKPGPRQEWLAGVRLLAAEVAKQAWLDPSLPVREMTTSKLANLFIDPPPMLKPLEKALQALYDHAASDRALMEEVTAETLADLPALLSRLSAGMLPGA